MLRSLVALVVLANLLFFAWARGWLAPAWPAPRHAEREPERLAAQVRPDTLSVVPPTAASAAVAAARAASLWWVLGVLTAAVALRRTAPRLA